MTSQQDSGKQNVTISLSRPTLRKAKVLAARRDTSISRLLAQQIEIRSVKTKNLRRAERQAIQLLEQAPTETCAGGFRRALVCRYRLPACRGRSSGLGRRSGSRPRRTRATRLFIEHESRVVRHRLLPDCRPSGQTASTPYWQRRTRWDVRGLQGVAHFLINRGHVAVLVHLSALHQSYFK